MEPNTEVVENQEATQAPHDQTVSEEGPTPEVGGFFDDEQVSENELRGIDGEETDNSENQDESGQEEEAATDPPEDKPGEQKGETEKTETDDQTAAEKTESESEEGETETAPPKGFVPYQALSEERGKRQKLTQEVADLKVDLEEALAGKPEDGAEEFKVLSDADFEQLAEEDPSAAAIYQHKLNRYQNTKRKTDAAASGEQDQIDFAATRINELVPGIYDEGSKTGDELADFAIESGFDPDFLTILTDPRTKIIPHEGKGATLLANGAASVIGMINALKSGKAGAQTDRAAIEAELTKEITERVTAEVMGKLKAGGDATPTSINDLPGNAETPGEQKALTEDELARLPEAERKAYLGG